MNTTQQIYGIAVGTTFNIGIDVYNLRMGAGVVAEVTIVAAAYDFDPSTGSLRTRGPRADDQWVTSWRANPERRDIFVGRLIVDGVEVYRDPRAGA